MIGHSRSGKTSYMAGLYNQFGDNKDGIGITTYDTSKKAKLKQLGSNLASGVYPKGTDIASEYNFHLMIEGDIIIPFNWYDYRGGALMQNSKSSPEVAILIKKIEDADALIVFLDGEKLANDEDIDDFEDEYDVIIWSIQKAILNKKSTNYFPISFVITKGDLFDDYSILYESEGLDYFMPLIKNIKGGSAAAGMLSVCEVASNGIFNILPPLLFSLYYGMPEYIGQRMDYLNSEINHYNSLWPNLIDDTFGVLSKIFGSGDYITDREQAVESMKRIQKEKKNLEFLDSCKDGMKEIIDKWVEQNIIMAF
jgi:hypothetical protein